MKVNTGSAKGKRLKAVPGTTTRPITDRTKQALFNILMDDVRDSRWLDLFGGTGAVGIEALSRGAAACVFLDVAPAAVKTIENNLRETGVTAKGKVIRQDALRYVAGRPNATYDFVYVAPPQYQSLWSRVLTALDENIGWLHEDSTVIVQIDPSEFVSLELNNLTLGDQRSYGRTMLCFYDVATPKTANEA
jgi:16S rRNA (guanine(966)-N(2))-methyltransferase RsmD